MFSCYNLELSFGDSMKTSFRHGRYREKRNTQTL